MPSIRLSIVFSLAILVGCSHVAPRPERSYDELVSRKASFQAAREERLASLSRRVVDRMELIKDGRAKDDAFDMLLLSGGGDWGVFGAAFLRGWGDNSELPRPEFDYVAGISTGAYIAAYTISGAPERYDRMERFYLDFNKGALQTFNPLGAVFTLLEGAPSLLDSSTLRAAVENAVDDELVEEILAADREKRSLVVGAVNLDMGALAAFEIGSELRAAEDPRERLVTLLLASSAVPGLLTPVMVDGDLYVDGGAAVGIPIFRLDELKDMLVEWRRRRGRQKPPKIRFWVLFNNKIGLRPMVTRTAWNDVLLRSYKVAIQTSLAPPVVALDETTSMLSEMTSADIELRWSAIPEEFDDGPPTDAFDPDLMRALSELGESMGRDAASWKVDPPPF